MLLTVKETALLLKVVEKTVRRMIERGELGRSEAWITDRTGHRSSQMIYRYKRAARTHAELELGTFEPLYEAIPELAAPEKDGS